MSPRCIRSTLRWTLSNVGNLIHWIYVASLPVGPIWFLHGFFTVTTALMLVCYMRFQRSARFA